MIFGWRYQICVLLRYDVVYFNQEVTANKAGPSGALSKAEICGRSPADIMGSNLTEGMDVCLLWVFRVVW
jgi:hypothetical protein